MISAKKYPNCSFCGKNKDEVQILIAAPGTFICDECVDLCNEILGEKLEVNLKKDRLSFPEPTAPSDISFVTLNQWRYPK